MKDLSDSKDWSAIPGDLLGKPLVPSRDRGRIQKFWPILDIRGKVVGDIFTFSNKKLLCFKPDPLK